MDFEFLKRRDFIYEKFNKIEGLECIKPDGAFCMFTSCKGILGKNHLMVKSFQMMLIFQILFWSLEE